MARKLDEGKRNAILREAKKKIIRFGFQKTTLDEIARDAGVAKATIYIYFEDKKDLLRELLLQDVMTYFESSRKAADKGKTALDKIQRIIKASIRLRKQNLLINSFYRDGPHIWGNLYFSGLQEIEKVITDFVAEIIREGIEEKALRPMDVELAAFTFFKVFQMYILTFDAKKEQRDLRRAIDFLLHLMEN